MKSNQQAWLEQQLKASTVRDPVNRTTPGSAAARPSSISFFMFMPRSKDDRPAPLSAQAPWKIVFFHHPPYSSGSTHGSNKVMQWPFAEWGANLILGALLNVVHSEHT